MAVIKLESPFKEFWRKGYLVVNKEPRRNVVLYNSDKDRTTIAYAKYLMSVKLGRILESHEIVDHINDDKMDDRVDNYQIISNKDNLTKSVIQKNKSRQYVEYECPCGTIFERDRRNSNLIPCKSHMSCYCSKQCSGLFGGRDKSILIREYRKDAVVGKEVLMKTEKHQIV